MHTQFVGLRKTRWKGNSKKNSAECPTGFNYYTFLVSRVFQTML